MQETSSENNIEVTLIQRKEGLNEQQDSFLQNFCKFSLNSVQTAISYEMEQLSGFITLIILGNSIHQETGHFGFALALSNLLGNCISNGISNGLESISSHAYGAQDYNLMGVYYNKTLILQIVFSTISSLLFFFSKDILLILGFDIDLAESSGQYLQLIIPGFLATVIYESLRAQLHAMNIFDIQMYITIISLLFHIGWSYLFISYLGWNIKGAALAKNIVEIQNLILLYIVATKKGYIKQFNQNFTRSQLRDWIPFSKVVFGVGFIVMFDWVAYELYTFQAGKLKDNNELNAQAILATTYMCVLQFAFAIQTTANTYVGNAVGEGNKKLAIQFSKIAMLMSLASFLVSVLFFKIFFKYASHIFLQNESVTPILDSLLPILIAVIFFDYYQMGQGGVIRSINKQYIGSIVTFVSQFVIAAPLTYYITYSLDLGIKGIWIGMCIPLILISICYTLTINFSSWDKCIGQVQDRLTKDSKNSVLYSIGNYKL